MTRLHTLLGAQYKLQVDAFNINFAEMHKNPQKLQEYVRWNVLALEDELHEALNEISWKPWAEGAIFNREAFQKELIDALHFWMNLALLTMHDQRIPALAAELTDRYFAKRKINADRQASGTYDGFGTKCPDCGRAVEDGEQQEGENLPHKRGYVCVCGRVNYLDVT